MPYLVMAFASLPLSSCNILQPRVSSEGMAVTVSSGTTKVEITAKDGQAGTSMGDITFESVSAKSGSTGSILLIPKQAADAGYVSPTAFALSEPPIYYDVVSVNLKIEGNVTLCLNYPDTIPPVERRLFHYVDGAWKDITTSFNK